VLVGWRSFIQITISTVCVVITVAMVMLLRDFVSYGIKLMTVCVCVCVCIFPSFLTGNLLVIISSSDVEHPVLLPESFMYFLFAIVSVFA
jgi:hypothetical protein